MPIRDAVQNRHDWSTFVPMRVQELVKGVKASKPRAILHWDILTQNAESHDTSPESMGSIPYSQVQR
jgi:hypothetical protein